MNLVCFSSRGSRSSIIATAILIVGLALSFPVVASADGWVSGFFGRAFGGETGLDFSQATKNRDTWTYGFNAGAMGGGVAGAEFDFGYTPNFFGEGGNVVDSSGVMTVMASVIIGIPAGGQSGAGIRPYGFFGVGLIRRNIGFVEFFDELSTNDIGWNTGGGIMGFFNRTLGIRGEYRYFRNFSKDESGSGLIQGEHFNFSRASLGIVLRF